MPALTLIVPGSIETRTGGYGYDRCIAAGLRAAGWDVRVIELDSSFPTPTDTARADAARALREISDGSVVIVDGLAFGAMPEEAERERTRLRMIALVHHPLAREAGIATALAARLEETERRALAAAWQVVVTSEATARTLGEYGVSRDRIAVVEPGTDPAPLARGSRAPDVHLLCVAAIALRKGYDVLLHALARIPSGWRLTCVGSTTRDPETASFVRRLATELGLGDRVAFAGELEGEALAAAYDRADVFVLPMRYEGYGMAVAEALARGLPVVSTRTGAIPHLVGEAGILVDPGDEGALAEALVRVISSAEVRGELADAARAARARLTDWTAAARRMVEVVSVAFRR